MEELWFPLLLSFRVAGVATLAATLVAVPLAYGMARRRFPGQILLEGCLLLPLVLPPTVVGYLILSVFGHGGYVGRWFGDYSIVFRFEGAVLAAAIVALPMLYMPAKAAFQNVDRDLEDISRTLGASRLQLFWHVSLPMARRGLISGVILAFARAIGEFGATVMVFGWQPGRLTLPISIYSAYERGEMQAAFPAVAALLVMSFVLVMGYHLLSGRRGE